MPPTKGSSQPKALVADERFKHVHTDPRFRRAAKTERKFKPDARFQKMFTDKAFNDSYKVDAFGRRIATDDAKVNKELQKYYQMDDEATAEVAQSANSKQRKHKATTAGSSKPTAAAASAKGASAKSSKTQRAAASAADDDDEDAHMQDSDEDNAGAADDSDAGSDGYDGNYLSTRKMAPPSSDEEGGDDDDDEDSAAGGDSDDDAEVDADAAAESDADESVGSSGDEEESVGSSGEEESDIEMLPGSSVADAAAEDEEEANVERGEQPYKRVAVCNMEWDRLSAVDLLVLFRSIVPLPPGRVTHPVQSVRVMRSQYGKERMHEEAVLGPSAIVGGADAKQRRERILKQLADAPAPEYDDGDAEDAAATAAAEEEEEESDRTSDDDDDESNDDGTQKKRRVSFAANEKKSRRRKRPSKAEEKKEEKKENDDIAADKESDADVDGSASASDDNDDHSAAADAAATDPDHRQIDLSSSVEYDPEALRRYELQRLKYFYAIVECDNAATAEQLYKECDGLEFERSSNVLDLRFIPDDVEYTTAELEEDTRDYATTVPAKYSPPDFYTAALQHTKVQLTWESGDPIRERALKRKFTKEEEAEADLAAYLGSEGEEDGYGTDAATEAEISEDEEETTHKSKKKQSKDEKKTAADADADDDDDADADTDADASTKAKRKVTLKRRARNKYRALLDELKSDVSSLRARTNDAGEKEISVTFTPGLREKAEELVKNVEAKKEQVGETAWEKHLRLQKEKKKAKKLARKEKIAASTTKKDSDRQDGSDNEDIIGGGGSVDKGKSDLYEDDAVDVDDDDFFRHSDDDADNDDADADDNDIDALPAKQKAKAMFDESSAARLKKKGVNTKDDKAKKRKRSDADADSDADAGADAESKAEKAKQRAELELLLAGHESDEERGYSLSALLKQKKAAANADKGGKRASKKARREGTDENGAAVNGADQADFKVNVADERFAALYNQPQFSIDPTHPYYKATEGTDLLLQEKARKRQEAEKRQRLALQQKKKALATNSSANGHTAAAKTDVPNGAADTNSAAGPQLSSLVASIKRKAAAASQDKVKSAAGNNVHAPPSKRARPEAII